MLYIVVCLHTDSSVELEYTSTSREPTYRIHAAAEETCVSPESEVKAYCFADNSRKPPGLLFSKWEGHHHLHCVCESVCGCMYIGWLTA